MRDTLAWWLRLALTLAVMTTLYSAFVGLSRMLDRWPVEVSEAPCR